MLSILDALKILLYYSNKVHLQLVDFYTKEFWLLIYKTYKFKNCVQDNNDLQI